MRGFSSLVGLRYDEIFLLDMMTVVRNSSLMMKNLMMMKTNLESS